MEFPEAEDDTERREFYLAIEREQTFERCSQTRRVTTTTLAHSQGADA